MKTNKLISFIIALAMVTTMVCMPVSAAYEQSATQGKIAAEDYSSVVMVYADAGTQIFGNEATLEDGAFKFVRLASNTTATSKGFSTSDYLRYADNEYNSANNTYGVVSFRFKLDEGCTDTMNIQLLTWQSGAKQTFLMGAMKGGHLWKRNMDATSGGHQVNNAYTQGEWNTYAAVLKADRMDIYVNGKYLGEGRYDSNFPVTNLSNVGLNVQLSGGGTLTNDAICYLDDFTFSKYVDDGFVAGVDGDGYLMTRQNVDISFSQAVNETLDVSKVKMYNCKTNEEIPFNDVNWYGGAPTVRGGNMRVNMPIDLNAGEEYRIDLSELNLTSATGQKLANDNIYFTALDVLADRTKVTKHDACLGDNFVYDDYYSSNVSYEEIDHAIKITSTADKGVMDLKTANITSGGAANAENSTWGVISFRFKENIKQNTVVKFKHRYKEGSDWKNHDTAGCLEITTDGNFYVRGASSEEWVTSSTTYDRGQWNNFAAIFWNDDTTNYPTGYVTYLINGQEIKDASGNVIKTALNHTASEKALVGTPFIDADKNITISVIDVNLTLGAANDTIYIDDPAVSQYVPSTEYVHQIRFNDYKGKAYGPTSDVSTVTRSIDVKFKSNDIDVSSATFALNGAEVTNKDTSKLATDGVVTLSLDEGVYLEKNTEYTLAISGAKKGGAALADYTLKFKTDETGELIVENMIIKNNGTDVTDTSAALAEGDDITVETNVINTKDDTASNYSLLMGVYDREGRLTDVDFSQVPVGGATKTHTFTLNSFNNISLEKAQTTGMIRGFFWNGLDSMMPILSPVEFTNTTTAPQQ